MRLPVSIGRTQAALSADISDSGFCLEVPRTFEPGTEIDGYVLHGEHELAFGGTVAWFEHGDPQASTWHRMGVRFRWVSSALRTLLTVEQRRRRR